MNKILNALVACVLVALAVSVAEPQERSIRWKYYATDGVSNDHYYETKSVVYVSGGIVKVELCWI